MILPAARRYQHEQDLAQMLALLQAGRAAGSDSYYVHTGDIKWWLYYPPLGVSLWEHLYLWESPNGRLLGWALVDPHGGTFDVFFQPELYETPVAEAMYAWAEKTLIEQVRAAGQKKVQSFWVTPQDRFRTCWLEERGYQVKGVDTRFIRSLAQPIPDCGLPKGYQVRPCQGLAEVEARARAQYGAFGSSAPFEQYVERFRHFMQSPAYSPDSDIIAVAPDGAIAAFCITWEDELNRTALFEPVGTHPDYQRKGLGKAVMLEALRRLQAKGMLQAILCTPTDNTPAVQLYTALGFQPSGEFRFYSKDLDE